MVVLEKDKSLKNKKPIIMNLRNQSLPAVNANLCYDIWKCSPLKILDDCHPYQWQIEWTLTILRSFTFVFY